MFRPIAGEMMTEQSAADGADNHSGAAADHMAEHAAPNSSGRGPGGLVEPQAATVVVPGRPIVVVIMASFGLAAHAQSERCDGKRAHDNPGVLHNFEPFSVLARCST